MKNPKFEPNNCGEWDVPVVGIDPKLLREYLPAKFRQHPRTDAFLAAVADWAAEVAHMAADVPSLTDAEKRDQLVAIEDVAHRLQGAMQPLASRADEFSELHADFAYLKVRARDIKALSGRPVVPALPASVPPLPELLARIENDLQTLRTVCAHTAGKITPVRSTPKHHERMLVRGIAELYRSNFGELPAKRGQFADAFIEHIAQAMEMAIGHRVVGEVVASLT